MRVITTVRYLTLVSIRAASLSFMLAASVQLIGAETLPEAVHRADTGRIRSILAGQPDLETKDEDGNTALHWAALRGDAHLVKELLQRGAAANATNRAGATPLIYAAGNLTSVKALLDAGAAVNVTSKFGTTPLIAAARYPQSTDIVLLLLNQGADWKAKDKADGSALTAATYARNLDTVKLLISAGLKPADVIMPAVLGEREILETELAAGADLRPTDSSRVTH
jgi:ankyrin repeat protein